jgi:PHD/YefM family antitoxin component YafN of YafNO toxin-antitoxin module
MKNTCMLSVHPQYITDNNGKKISAIIPMKEFKTMMEELEELEDIKQYDKVKKSNEPSIAIDDAFTMIEAKRKKK